VTSFECVWVLREIVTSKVNDRVREYEICCVCVVNCVLLAFVVEDSDIEIDPVSVLFELRV
jgi:hypothetical protein